MIDCQNSGAEMTSGPGTRTVIRVKICVHVESIDMSGARLGDLSNVEVPEPRSKLMEALLAVLGQDCHDSGCSKAPTALNVDGWQRVDSFICLQVGLKRWRSSRCSLCEHTRSNCLIIINPSQKLRVGDKIARDKNHHRVDKA
jgi:hypothetical protein